MQIDLRNVKVEENERVYINEEGEFVLKVVKITEGETSNKNPQIKVHFQDRLGRWLIDDFTITPNALWKIKLLTNALKLPEIVNTEMFIDRYVRATIKMKKADSKEYFEVKKYEPSSLTSALEVHPNISNATAGAMPAPNYGEKYQENVQEKNYTTPPQLGAPTDEDEIPF